MSTISKFNWAQFKADSLAKGLFPLAIWGQKRNGRRELIHHDAFDSDQERSDALTEFSSCFWCFDSVFYCYVDECGKFHSVTYC